jgi:hypothetical protein
LISIFAGCGSPTPGMEMGPLPDMSTLPDLAQASMCTAAVQQLLVPIDQVSTGSVVIVSNMNGVKTVYVDATAGGINGESTHPRIYVSLANANAVPVTDKTAHASTAWDLAFKRPVIFTNDGDGGSGMGGALFVAKDFASVTASDAQGMTFATEMFVDADCNPQLDATGSVQTTMSTWYDYNLQTNMLTPKAGTWIIRGGTGTLFKLAIQDYYSSPNGMPSGTGGRFLMQVAAL